MFPTMEIEISPDLECQLFLEPDYQAYDSSPGRQTMTAEQKHQQRERDKALFMDEYFAAYDWGPYKWSSPDFEVTELLWLLGLIDFIDDRRKPTNNAELEAALKAAVSEGLLIPEIHYCDRGGMAASVVASASTGGVVDGILTSSSSSDSNGWLGAAEAATGVAAAGTLGYAASTDTASTTTDFVSADTSSIDTDSTTTPLSDAQPFQYSDDSPRGDVTDLAARGVSEEDETECHAAYEEDMETCQVASAMYRDPRTFALCTQRAFDKFQACRGY